MRRKLTDRLVEELPLKNKRYMVMDIVAPGLGVRISPSGRKTYVMVARFAGANSTRRHLGTCVSMTLEEARQKVRALHLKLGREEDPERRPEPTFGQVYWQFQKHIDHQRRAYDVASGVRREFLPRWQDRPLSSITRTELLQVTDAAIARGAPWAAHHAWANARRIFNFAIARGIVEKSPCDRVRPRDIIGPKAPRQRVLNDDEIRALWNASEFTPYPYGQLWKLLLVTGQRKSEVAEARWQEFDLEAALWTIPPERFKSNATHMVPLTTLAVEILRSLPRNGDLLFGSVNGFGKAKTRLDQAMGDPPHFVIHDIRRTVRTRLASLRIPHEVAEMVIGHGRKGLARVYDQHHYLSEMREDLLSWSQALLGMIKP